MKQILSLGACEPSPNAVTGLNPDENYCLRWNEYEKKYAETFRYELVQERIHKTLM